MKKHTIPRKTIFALTLILIFVASSTVVLLQPNVLLGRTEPEKQTTSNNNSTQTKTKTEITTSITTITSSTQNTSLPSLKIIRKQIPPNYVMGNPVDVGLTTGMNFLIVENPAEKASIRFTAKLTGEVKTLTIEGLTSSGQLEIRIGLQEDNAGVPKGEWMSFGTLEMTSKEMFVTVNLQQPVTVTQGKVYHVVIEAAGATTTNQALLLTYSANSLNEPFNSEDPDIVSPDPMINTLTFDGNRWQEENKWPVYAIGFSDGRLEGQPYSLVAQWVINGPTYVGQTIIPASDYKVGKIAFVVNFQGQPTDKLYYEITDSSNEVLVKGVFAETSQVSSTKKWIEVTLPSPIVFTAGKLYRISLFSPGTSLENAYELYGGEFTYNSSIGYGGLQHQLTVSENSGSTWSDWTDADAIFKITTATVP